MSELNAEKRVESETRTLTPEEERQKTEALSRVYAMLIRLGQKRHAKEVDLSVYTLPWVYNDDACTWICDVPPNRGSIQLVQTGIFWHWEACIERPDHFKNTSLPFHEPGDALGWAEQKLIAIQNEVEEPEQEAPRLTLADFSPEKQPHLAPYWIDAHDIEPQRITYRVLIDLEYTPYDYETMEMSFGKKYHYNKKFATPTRLARDLNIDATQVHIEQPIGENDGWYRITSSTSYYSEPLAAAQAQQLWDKSAIVRQYNAGQVIRARYGYVEVETHYTVMLGGCESPDRPYAGSKSRSEFMAGMALRQTLIYALDVEGFRAYMGIPREWEDDEKMLASMHELRAESVHLPLETRAKSQQWLAAHKVNHS